MLSALSLSHTVLFQPPNSIYHFQWLGWLGWLLGTTHCLRCPPGLGCLLASTGGQGRLAWRRLGQYHVHSCWLVRSLVRSWRRGRQDPSRHHGGIRCGAQGVLQQGGVPRPSGQAGQAAVGTLSAPEQDHGNTTTAGTNRGWSWGWRWCWCRSWSGCWIWIWCQYSCRCECKCRVCSSDFNSSCESAHHLGGHAFHL